MLFFVVLFILFFFVFVFYVSTRDIFKPEPVYNALVKIIGPHEISVYNECPWCNCYSRRKWTRVQTLDETDCILHCTNTLGKGMNLIILPPAVGK